MNKADLITITQTSTGLARSQAADAVEAVFRGITDTLAAGEKVQIVGFGTFEVRKRSARTGVNPQTKEKIMIEECTVPSFKAGKALKDAVSGKC